jgi:hypothetical protein
VFITILFSYSIRIKNRPDVAYKAIQRYVLDQGETFKLINSQFDSIEGIELSQGIISEGIASKGVN